MSLITLLMAGAITAVNTMLPASQQLDPNNNVYQTYLPSQKIGMEIFKGDYESGYKLGIVLYYSNSTYAANSTPWDTNLLVRDWNLKIRANDTILYETSNFEHGPLVIDGSLKNSSGENQTLRTNQYNEYTPPLFYFHSVYTYNGERILPLETLHYEMNARDYYNAETKNSNIKLTAELETPGPLGRDGLWCINLATFKTEETAGTFSYYSAFNTAVYTYNETLDMNSLTSYSQALYLPVAESEKHFTYTTDNSKLRTWFGVSTINENNFYNHIMKGSLTTTYGSENLKTSFTATPNQEQFGAFSIQYDSYFYIRYQQQQRTPERMYVIKDMVKTIDERNYEKSSVLLHEYILEFRYSDKLSGGVPSGGSAGGNNGDFTIECSGGSIFANLGCYLNNALGNIITQGPLFKPVMNFIEKFNDFIDNTAGLFFRILDILKGDIL